jgi:hypothetical protein
LETASGAGAGLCFATNALVSVSQAGRILSRGCERQRPAAADPDGFRFVADRAVSTRLLLLSRAGPKEKPSCGIGLRCWARLIRQMPVSSPSRMIGPGAVGR